MRREHLKRWKDEWLARRRAVGKYRRTHSTKRTRKVFNVTRMVAEYWLKKVQDRAFHSGKYGGRRYVHHYHYHYHMLFALPQSSLQMGKLLA
jgi:hypothetical protein